MNTTQSLVTASRVFVGPATYQWDGRCYVLVDGPDVLRQPWDTYTYSNGYPAFTFSARLDSFSPVA